MSIRLKWGGGRYEANRNWAMTGTPKILTHSLRLEGEVEHRSRVYLTLQEQYELANFPAQKDVLIVRIFDQPLLPTQKSGPFRRNLIIRSDLISFGLTIPGIFITDLVQHEVTTIPNQVERVPVGAGAEQDI